MKLAQMHLFRSIDIILYHFLPKLFNCLLTYISTYLLVFSREFL